MKRPGVLRSFAFRLTLWYAGVLSATTVLCFFAAFQLINSKNSQQIDQHLQRVVAECRRVYAEGGMKALEIELLREGRSTGINDIFALVRTSGGAIEASSDLTEWMQDKVTVRAVSPGADVPTSTVTWKGLPSHARARVTAVRLSEDRILVVGFSLQSMDARLAALTRMLIGFGGGAVLLAVLGGWLMARRAMARVDRVTDTASRIAIGELHSRVPTSGWDDEVDLLARSFNAMIDRVAALVRGIKQTNDNIAHELRSPITRMRGLAEVNLSSAVPGSEHHGLAVDTVEECDRLLALINTMLDIAEVEAGIVPLSLLPTNVSEIVRDACDIFEPVAEQAGVLLEADVPDAVNVRGDVSKLQRAVANIVDNAIKYTPRGGTVTVVVRTAGGWAEVIISDTGPGITDADLPHIFQRFYRAEKSRTHKGYGLGLSLAQAIVGAHLGSITVENVQPHGCRFMVRLPLAPAENGAPATETAAETNSL